MFDKLIELDENVLLWIQEHLRCDLLTKLFTIITHLGDKGYIWIGIALILLFTKKYRSVGIMVSCSLIGSLIINNLLLKNIVARTRPYEMILNLQYLIEKPTDLSFPSGHTGSSFAAAIILILAMPKRYGVPAIILAVLISFSRLYLGVHYPTDVIVGAVTGTLIAICVYKTLKDRLIKKESPEK